MRNSVQSSGATSTLLHRAGQTDCSPGLIRASLLLLLLAVSSGCPSGDDSPPAPTTAPPPAAAANDPLFSDQWHLQNTGQNGATAGEDVRVAPVWAGGRKGEEILIAVVDDGLELAHEDLAPNIAAGMSFNYQTSGTDPTPTAPADNHGTAVAGVAAARDLNNLGGAGSAPRASLAGYNLIAAGGNTTTNEADAMARNAASVHLSNNSWGPADDGQLHPAATAWKTAINTGLTTGRGARGTIYTWAAGNGGSSAPVDNSNYDGRANHRGVLAICAVGDDGKKASYSEEGANLWVCAPSLGRGNHGITTTDRTGAAGYNTAQPLCGTDSSNTNYTNCFNGTSASAPLAAGVIALILQAKPNLTWRDARLILAETARKNDPGDAEWKEDGGADTTGAQYHFNHKYGFGVTDAQRAVARALTWTNVAPGKTPFTTALASPALLIPDNNPTGVSHTITVNGSGIASIEFIEIAFTTVHTYDGDLQITLTHDTTGAQSRLAENRICAGGAPCGDYTNWVFGSARHLGEAADGNWTLTVKDLAAVDLGTFQSWQLTFYGR